MRRSAGRSVMVLFSIALATAPEALAIDVPDYGFEWCVIGDPGNRDTLPNEVPLLTAFEPESGEFGGVDHLFRITKTEITVGQWFEFVEAYLPHYWTQTGFNVALDDFTGRDIRVVFGVPEIVPGVSPNQPSRMSWQYATRFCNWLHNGKILELWAFETGVYEVDTYYEDPEDVWHFQERRNPGALFFLPTYDEWVKAAYYDPDRYGEGRPGYWLFPNTSNRQSIGNLLPEHGGERNAGLGGVWPLDVGSFPWVLSPWGLLDCSGGLEESLETHSDDCFHPIYPCLWRRYVGGTHYSEYWTDDPFTVDRLEFMKSWTIGGASIGMRLASVVPCGADFDPPWGILDLVDVRGFVNAFLSGDPAADFAEPAGVLTTEDVLEFINQFSGRCGSQ